MAQEVGSDTTTAVENDKTVDKNKTLNVSIKRSTLVKVLAVVIVIAFAVLAGVVVKEYMQNEDLENEINQETVDSQNKLKELQDELDNLRKQNEDLQNKYNEQVKANKDFVDGAIAQNAVLTDEFKNKCAKVAKTDSGYDCDGIIGKANEATTAKQTTGSGTQKITPLSKGGVTSTMTNPGDSNSAQNPTQDLCNTMISGWGRPQNCPFQSRAQFTALGGWELTLREELKTPHYYRYSHFATNCYTKMVIDWDTKTISDVEWDGDDNWVCALVKNEHPPLPSAEYLTNYLRSLL